MRGLPAILAFSLLILPAAVQAANPQPPCGATSSLGFPSPDAAPVITVWQGSELDKSNWQPPSCTGWTNHSKLVISLAGSLRFDGTMDRLLSRLTAVSVMRNVQYWSTTNKEWRPLAYDAYALKGPDAKLRRPDFTAPEISKGATLYYWADDTRTGPVITRLKVSESTPDRAVVISENVTPIKQFIFTLFDPGALQSTIFIQRLSPDIFGVYILTRTGDGTSMLASGHDASFVNRAVAVYRQIAGIKTDQEPPALR